MFLCLKKEKEYKKRASEEITDRISYRNRKKFHRLSETALATLEAMFANAFRRSLPSSPQALAWNSEYLSFNKTTMPLTNQYFIL